MKSSERRRGVFFLRWRPEDDTLSARVRAAFERKAAKLARYQREGKTTVLLVENDDIALMNEEKMLAAIQEAFPNRPPAGVSQVRGYLDPERP